MIVVGIGELIFLALIISGVTFLYILPIIRRRAAMLDKPKREVLTGDDGEVISVGERERSKSFRRTGKGSYASDALNLYAGVYRLEYGFPPTAPVAFKLINVDTAEELPVLIKSGSGSHAFRIEQSGRYVVDLDPTDTVQGWEISFRQL